MVDARGEAAGRLQAALRETEVGAAGFGIEAGDPRRVVLNVQFVDDRSSGWITDMARRRVGRMVVDHALAAAGVDRLPRHRRTELTAKTVE